MNFSYTTNPGYVDLFYDLYRAIKWHYKAENWGDYQFPRDFFVDMRRYFNSPVDDAYPVIYIAILFTIARYGFEWLICKPLVNRLNLDNKSDREKFPESLWKFLTYSFTWGYCYNLLIYSGKYNYFTEPTKLWDDWSISMVIPYDIKFLYYLECGFYLHSVYSTMFMDTMRKDFFVMLLHHVLTMTLLTFSYATRYHKVGLMVIFVHDITDILLEFTKCNVYLKKRNGKFYAYHEHISNIGFAAFTVSWYLFRLYWFPLRILYTSSVVSTHVAAYRGAGLYAFFNSLLWLLLCLDIYWFYFIVLFLYKVATGQLKEIEDTREYENDKKEAKKEK